MEYVNLGLQMGVSRRVFSKSKHNGANNARRVKIIFSLYNIMQCNIR